MNVRRRRPGHYVRAVLQAAGLVILVLGCMDDARAENLGRWFFSGEERRTLDELRDAGEEPKPIVTTRDKKAVAPVVDVISFDGKVERSDGGSTIWVNGRPVFTGNRTAEGIRIRSSRGTDGETRFELPPSDTGTTKFSLKAGQKVAVQNGRKFDAFELRPGEEAESVFDDAKGVESGAKPDRDPSDGDKGAPSTPPASPGS